MPSCQATSRAPRLWPVSVHRFTVDEVDALPLDGNRPAPSGGGNPTHRPARRLRCRRAGAADLGARSTGRSPLREARTRYPDRAPAQWRHPVGTRHRALVGGRGFRHRIPALRSRLQAGRIPRARCSRGVAGRSRPDAGVRVAARRAERRAARPGPHLAIARGPSPRAVVPVEYVQAAGASTKATPAGVSSVVTAVAMAGPTWWPPTLGAR